MTETQAAVITALPFDLRSDDHIAALTGMFRDYLLEEFDRIGDFAPGFPFATWLKTFLVFVDGTPAGFCAADLARYSIELIYVRPEYRRHGIARRLLADLRDSCPHQMSLKAPVSPACRRLAEQLGIPVAHQPEAERLEGERSLADLATNVHRLCKHRRVGDPRRLCRTCYRALLKRVANRMVGEACLALRPMLPGDAART